MIELRIDPEFRDKIPPLTDAEFEQLRENILEDGEIYEPICVWNGTIIDGHNRWKIIQENPEIPFKVKEMNFSDKWAAFDWMYKKQLGRRNLTDEQRTVLIGKMYEARKKSCGGDRGNQYTKVASCQNDNLAITGPAKTARQIAQEVGVGQSTVNRAEKFSKGIDALAEVSKEAADKILAGGSGVNKKDVMDVPKMELEQRKEFAQAVISGEKPKPKPIKNSNIPSKPRSKKSEEDQEIENRVGRIIEIQNDINRDTSITIQDLAELVEEDGKDYVSSLRNMLVVRSTLLVGENRQMIAKVIENIINEIYKVKELLK